MKNQSIPNDCILGDQEWKCYNMGINNQSCNLELILIGKVYIMSMMIGHWESIINKPFGIDDDGGPILILIGV